MRKSWLTIFFAFIVAGCVSTQYIPPSYNAYIPPSSLPLTAALYFKPYDGVTPLVLAKHRYHFYKGDFIEIGFGVTTVRTVTSASEHLFAKCFEIRSPELAKQMTAPEVKPLFAEGIEIQQPTLAARLELCKTQNIDVLVEISVLEYVHSSKEAKMTLSWTIYDVKTLKQLLQEQVQISVPNNTSGISLFKLKECMVKNQELCGQVVVACVEKMVKSANLRLSDNNAYERKER